MKPLKPFVHKEAWLAFFLLGIVMLNYPFLVIFNKTTQIFGIPLLVLYFLLGWPLSIIVIFLFSERLFQDNDAGKDQDDHPGGDE